MLGVFNPLPFPPLCVCSCFQARSHADFYRGVLHVADVSGDSDTLSHGDRCGPRYQLGALSCLLQVGGVSDGTAASASVA